MKKKNNIKLIGLFLTFIMGFLAVGLIFQEKPSPSHENSRMQPSPKTYPRSAYDPSTVSLWRFEGSGTPDVGTFQCQTSTGIFKTSGGVNNSGYLELKGTDTAEITNDPSISGYPLTIEFWMRSVADCADQQEILKMENSSWVEPNYRVLRTQWDQYNHGNIKATAYVRDGANEEYLYATDTNDLAHNMWHQVVVVVKSNYIGYYLDGEHMYTDYASSGKIVLGDQNLIIGDEYVNADLHIDNLQIFSRILTDTEVRNRYRNTNPVPSFTISDQYPFLNEQVSFDASDTFAGAGSSYTFSWDFGDGTQMGTGTTITHEYSNLGTYTVTLNVTDSYGNTAQNTRNLYVYDDQWEENDLYWQYKDFDPYSEGNQISPLIQDDADYFRIGVNAHDSLTIQVTSTENLYDLQLNDMHPTDGTLIRYDTAEGDGKVEFSFAQQNSDQQYLVMINGSNLGTEYTLNVYTESVMDDGLEENDFRDMVNPIDLPMSYTDLIQMDEDWYGFKPSNTNVSISLNGSLDDYLWMELVDETGRVIKQAEKFIGQQSATITYESLSTTIEYYVRVSGDNVGAYYDLSIESFGAGTSNQDDGDTIPKNGSGVEGNPFEVDGYPIPLMFVSIAIAGVIFLKRKRENTVKS